MLKLQIENSEQIVYNNGLLILTVLGGVKLEGLDRLRVTLKIELPDSPQPPLRHNLDLYNDNQFEKLVRKTAERLETGTSVIAASLAELTEQLELYRLEQIKQQAVAQPPKPLTEGERQSALESLKAPDLMEQTETDLQGTGIQGERENSMILLIAMTSRKCHDPLSVICLANCQGVSNATTHIKRIKAGLPEKGRVGIMTITDEQFRNIEIYNGQFKEIIALPPQQLEMF